MDIAWIFMSVLPMVADGFTVRGLSASLVAPLGSSVVLPCYVDDGLLMKDLEVEWRSTDSETLVHLYQDGESRPEAQQQDYHDRAHFFTEEIQHGNFSLRLDDLRAEDEGEYRCTVHIQQDSGETVVQIKDVERLVVSGSNRSVSAYGGEDVTLNCSVDSHITPEHIEEVSWKKTDKDGDITVMLYQDNETFPEASHEQYIDRVEFFTSEIPKGNFSLRLKSVRIEDKGVYICQVFDGHLSANATVVLGQLGFSSWHIAVLVFCFAAGSGALLLLCSLIYCRSKNTVTISTIWKLQLSLVFIPNICLFFAFLLWGFTEGSLNETVTCGALYILRPIMLIWALPFLKYLQGNLKPWIKIFTITREFAVFTVVVYAVLFSHGWRIRAHDATITAHAASGVLFGMVVLICLILSSVNFVRLTSRKQPRVLIRDLFASISLFSFKTFINFYLFISLLSFSQLFQLFHSFGFTSEDYVFIALTNVLVLMPLLLNLSAVLECLHRKWVLLLWIIPIPLLDIIIVVYIYLVFLERENDYLEWIFIIVFLEVLKMIAAYTFEKTIKQRQQQQTGTSQPGPKACHLCNEIMYMYGAVGVVLLSSVTLTSELIMKARNGERVIEDLRIIIFPSECAFALCWLVLGMHAYWEVFTGQRNTPQRGQLRSTEENREMEILSAADSAVSQ